MADVVELLLGLVVLGVGADLLVRGAVGLAALLRIPQLIIGLTIVSFGTSAPELVVSLQAALKGSGGIAIGNVVGSNIANVLLVLGLPSVIRATELDSRGSNRNMLFMLAVTFLFIWLAWDGTLSRLDGLLLLALLVLFFAGQAAGSLSARRKGADENDGKVKAPRSPWVCAGLALAGLVSLPFAADATVDGALGVAEHLGVSETAVGVTIVAFGTSLPELAAAVAAAIRGHSAMALGNVIGSNIFNILAILGITASVVPVAVPMDFFQLEMWAMMAATLLLVPFVLMSWPIGRLTGAVMAATYVAAAAVFLTAPGA